jgi:hypothetical protein
MHRRQAAHRAKVPGVNAERARSEISGRGPGRGGHGERGLTLPPTGRFFELTGWADRISGPAVPISCIDHVRNPRSSAGYSPRRERHAEAATIELENSTGPSVHARLEQDRRVVQNEQAEGQAPQKAGKLQDVQVSEQAGSRTKDAQREPTGQALWNIREHPIVLQLACQPSLLCSFAS